MNISGLFRSMMGDMKAGPPKALELKAGEVVKGTVIQSFSDQEALVNIGGVQVRARLETPLKQGEVTMLQVQPESDSGQIVLKPLHSSNVQIAEVSLGEVLKTVGLSDSPANRQLVQLLHQAGVPLTKENVQAFSSLAAQLSASGSPEEWMPSAVVAFQKGLPLTQETVLSVKQAVQGPPLHETLTQLAAMADRELDSSSSSVQTRELLRSVKQLVDQVRQTAGQLIKTADTIPTDAGGAGKTAVTEGAPAAIMRESQAGGQAAASAQAARPEAGAVLPAASAGTAQASAATVAQAGAGAAPQADGAAASMAPSGADGAEPAPAARADGGATQPGAAAAGPGAPAAQPGAVGGGTAAAQAGAGAAPQAEGAAASMAPSSADGAEPATGGPSAASRAEAALGAPGAAAAESGSPPAQDEHLLSRLMKALGVEHEHQSLKQSEHQSIGSAGLPGAAGAEAMKTADTLKSVLLQLSQASDIPANVKEAAQQAVQQITGQQLLLSQDRTALFSHITLFVPIVGSNGEQTASVHIQSRKGKNGRLDASNCRLVFDLQMKALGDTMVDVQVVNRIVSLHIHNDLPFVGELLETNKEEIAQGLASAGYQFISLKCSAYPERKAGPAESSAAQRTAMDSRSAQLASVYGQKPYKGVDIRL